MKNTRNITLIGMPAAGKSTVGRLLAAELSYNFVDCDDLICNGEQQTLEQIIEKKGLETFLNIEAHHILNISCRRYIIATGGSVIYREKAMTHLANISTIIYLHVDLDTLGSRLSDLTSRGVAIDPEKSIEDLYKERTPLYDAWCDLKFNCQSLTADEVSELVLKSIKKFQGR